MRKIFILLVTAFLQIVLCVNTIDAADKKKSSVQKESVQKQLRPVTTPVSAYLNTSFDISVDKIPMPFLGHDIEKLYKAFEQRKRAERKDEFETTEQYKKRLSDIARQPIYGSIYVDSILTFVVDSDLEYNADDQIITLRVQTSSVFQSGQTDESKSAVVVKSAKILERKSTGQNVYGAKVEIEEFHSKTFELAVHNMFNFETEKVLHKGLRIIMENTDKSEYLEPYLESMKKKAFFIRLKMEPTEAREIKNKVAALILAKLLPPYISEHVILRKATFKDPKESSLQIYYVHVDILEIWFYDKTTGVVIAKIKGK